MASSQLFVVFTILAISAPSILATNYVVGDGRGWTINFNYQAWARGKMFYVGDNLVFNYPKGVHNVLKVNGTGFQQCSVPLDSVPLTSGHDVISLATPGRKWYICGVAQHCAMGGQKLLITVFPSSSAPSPSNPSWSAPNPSPTWREAKGKPSSLAPGPSPTWENSNPSWSAPTHSPTWEKEANGKPSSLAPGPSPTWGYTN